MPKSIHDVMDDEIFPFQSLITPPAAFHIISLMFSLILALQYLMASVDNAPSLSMRRFLQKINAGLLIYAKDH